MGLSQSFGLPIVFTVLCAACTSLDASMEGDPGFRFVSPDPSLDATATLREVPRRCFGSAHTIVVGPSPGCATLYIAASVFDPEPSCSSVDTVIVGSPLRIVRRGELPVEIEVRTQGPEGWLPGAGAYLAAQQGTDCCSGSQPTHTYGPITFDDHEVDNTLELLVTPERDHTVVRVCTVEQGTVRLDYRDECGALCPSEVACGLHPDIEACLARCTVNSAERTEACLLADLDARGCDATMGSGCGDVEDSSSFCSQAQVRWRYECGR